MIHLKLQEQIFNAVMGQKDIDLIIAPDKRGY